jgi:hypothetical protein
MSALVWIAIACAAIFLLCVGLAWALCAVSAPATPEERESEDQAQMAYLREWRHRHAR